jgi:hypothetical protein
MNYQELYTGSRERLIDAMVNLWLRGKGKEQAYLRHILTDKEPIMADPVFQSIFPWESSTHTFAEHSTESNILDKDFVEALSNKAKVDAEFLFPADRKPYKHQTTSWQTMLDKEQRKTIVVTSGTGSGKTECFMVPVLQDIERQLKTEAADGVRAIFLYPLNALMSSQRERIAAWCNALPKPITFALYNGDMEENAEKGEKRKNAYPELVSREEMRENPPQIMFTNPTMLNYMLLRAEDRPILEKSQGKLRWILLDEAHTYTGSAATELALQLRRVLQAFGVSADEVNFAVTSATMNGEDKDAAEAHLKQFVSQLTGKKTEDIVVVGGKRIVPELNQNKVEECLKEINADLQKKLVEINAALKEKQKEINATLPSLPQLPSIKLTFEHIQNLRQCLNDKPACITEELAKVFSSELAGLIGNNEAAREFLVYLIDLLGEDIEGLNADGGKSALLPTRINLFARTLGGIFTCVNPECKRCEKSPIKLGGWTTHQSALCPDCGAPLLEICTCGDCGGLMVTGEQNNDGVFQQTSRLSAIDKDPFGLNELEEEEPEEEYEESLKKNQNTTQSGFSQRYWAKPDSQQEGLNGFNVTLEKEGFVFSGDRRGLWKTSQENNQSRCPHCRHVIKKANFLRISAEMAGRTLAPLLLDHAPKVKEASNGSLHDGQKYIMFTDSRQGSAGVAMSLNKDMERVWLRAEIFRILTQRESEREEGPYGVRQGLTAEEEEKLEQLRAIPSNLFAKEINDLEAKRKPHIIAPAQLSFSDLETKILEDGGFSFKQLREHLVKARGIQENKTDAGINKEYLQALLRDYLAPLLKQYTSLETLGLLHFEYPDFEKAEVPQGLNISQEDWHDFLKIALDYEIRSNKHFDVSDTTNPWSSITQYTSPIFPSDYKGETGGLSGRKWPQVRKNTKGEAQSAQSRLVLLLCAGLGITNTTELKGENINIINSALQAAWAFLTKNILTMQNEGEGYYLKIVGSEKVKLSLTMRGYFCPETQVVVDTLFRGFSPRICGDLEKNNIKRYRVLEKSETREDIAKTWGIHQEDNPQTSVAEGNTEDPNRYILDYPYFNVEDKDNESEVNKWIEDNLKQQKKLGVLSNLMRRVYNRKSIYLAAEHSAQLKRADLKQYEDDFKTGKLNILSCSTTMEMGVDIGGILEVVMNNVPPKSANYLQRAGRAGRRGESKCMALTFCGPTPIGIYTWHNPTTPITGSNAMNLLKMDSKILVQRHINAFFFNTFMRYTQEQKNDNDKKFRLASRIYEVLPYFDFKDDEQDFRNNLKTVEAQYVKMMAYFDRLISNQCPDEVSDFEQFEKDYKDLVRQTALEKGSLSEAALKTKESLVSIQQAFLERTEKIAGQLQGKLIEIQKKAIKIRLNQLRRKNLLTYLAEENFLPSAALPTGLVECFLKQDSENNSSNNNHSVTRHRSRAIREFAPGTQVVRNEWVYTPEGILFKNKFQQEGEGYLLQHCKNCGCNFVNYGSIQGEGNSCPACQRNELQGIRDITTEINTPSRFTEVVEPLSFTVSTQHVPKRNKKNLGGFQIVEPLLLNMTPWEELSKPETNELTPKLLVRTSANFEQSKIMFYNKGTYGHGFALCTKCGRMKEEGSPNEEHNNPLENHKPLYGGKDCGGSIHRHVVLADRYNTDFVELRCFNGDNSLVKDRSLLRSLGVVLCRALTNYIGVNEDEVDFGYNAASNSIFLYDTAVGGAGYAPLFIAYREEILEKALASVTQCDCEKACTRCLIDRKSQWFQQDLDRKKLVEWLEMERDARKAPEEAKKALGEKTYCMTTTLDITLASVSIQNQLKKIRVYLDDNVSAWQPDSLRNLQTILNFKQKGIEVELALPRNIDIQTLELSEQLTLFTLLNQHKVVVVEDSTNKADNSEACYRPLMALVYQSERCSTYWGKNLNRDYSEQWGEGVSYFTVGNSLPTSTTIDQQSLFENLVANDGSIMFDSRINKDCNLSKIFPTLRECGSKENQWDSIIKTLQGKELAVTYTDRYLVTPLGCMLFVHLLKGLQDAIKCTFSSIEITMSNRLSASNAANYAVCTSFTNYDTRDNFLREAISQLLGIEAKVTSERYIAHERELKLTNSSVGTLLLRPDAGVGHGWVPNRFDEDGYTQEELKDFEFEESWKEDFYLHKTSDDILYTIGFTKA